MTTGTQRYVTVELLPDADICIGNQRPPIRCSRRRPRQDVDTVIGASIYRFKIVAMRMTIP
jgi:hypothetical protein